MASLSSVGLPPQGGSSRVQTSSSARDINRITVIIRYCNTVGKGKSLTKSVLSQYSNHLQYFKTNSCMLKLSQYLIITVFKLFLPALGSRTGLFSPALWQLCGKFNYKNAPSKRNIKVQSGRLTPYNSVWPGRKPDRRDLRQPRADTQFPIQKNHVECWEILTAVLCITEVHWVPDICSTVARQKIDL